LYQLSLKAGIIKPKKIDLLMLDEAGDINEVTLSIFMMLPARLKIMVGDNHQNIYSFNGTINGFEALKNVGQYFELTKSFRVAANIAKGVEAFCQKYLDHNVKFIGVEYKHSEKEINSNAYISRSNGSMIARMIDMDQRRCPYNLVRKASIIFELPLILVYLRPGGNINNEKYKILQKEADKWGSDQALQHDYPKLFKYIAEINKDDVEISGAIALMARFGIDTIMETYASALKHEKDSRTHFNTLCTAHSSKGLEFDSVYIDDDMNQCLTKILEDQHVIENGMSHKQKEEFRLYYVAISRCKHNLSNAEYVDYI
jgi:superfamily I DNA/RNA helicase